jgi:eukaryotic-like serine/threonine-protein kinase
MELTVQNVYGLLIRSKLLPLDEAKAMFARWQTEAGEGATNLARFAGWVVANKYLTEYQAALLARGHAEGFYINQYKVLDRIGRGRMAGVYKARHELGQIVAIKVLPPSRAKDANLLGRFQREARLAVRLNHPNVVRAFQVGEADSLHYLVMEYLEGETLDDVLTRRGKLPPTEAVRIVYQALQGLQHIHSLGLVHRDLKPANLMLVGAAADSTAAATVKILDIGLGRELFEEVAPDARGDETALTAEGVLLGTPDYMSPEQARDARSSDIRSDVYSLGCVLYHALAGQPPFPDTNIISQMIRHATEAPRPMRELNPAVPDGLQQIVGWMMAKDPAQRYPTPERAAQALQVFLAAGDGSLAAPEADPNMRSYLTWLEGEGEPKPPATKPVPLAVPVTTPPPLPNGPGKQDRSRPPSAKRRTKAKKGRRSSSKPPPVPSTPVAAPIPMPTSVVNVELVPVPTEQRTTGGRVTRRELVLFGIGVIAGAVAAFAGCLVALSGKKDVRRDEGDK